MISRTGPILPTTVRRGGSILLAALLMLVVAAPVAGYNNENELHVRLSQPQQVDCDEAAPLVATVTTRDGEPAPGITVTFTQHHGYPGETLAPTTDATDASGNAESSYTIPCGATSGSRVIKACEPSGACATTVVVCRQADGCTDETASAGVILATNRDTTTPTGIDASAVSAVATRRSADDGDALSLAGLVILALLATGMIRRRPKIVGAATPV